MEPEVPGRPETGSVRINGDGKVEYFDGGAWRPYEELADDGSESLFRGPEPDSRGPDSAAGS